MPVSEVVRLLQQSKRPLIHVGQGIRISGAVETFMNFVEAHGIPFVTARNANDICGWEHTHYIGRPGTFAQRGANFAVQTCDLYIAIGTSLSFTQTGYNSKDYARNAKIIQVDIDPAILEKNTVRHHLKICADAKDFIEELNKAEGIQMLRPWLEWFTRCREWKRRYPVCLPEYKEQKEYVNSYFFLDTLSDLATKEDVIVTDMGFAFQNTHQAWKSKQGQRLLTNCGLAPMGWGLPAAIGSSFAMGRRTLLITGEGGLMMNLQELATVMHHKLNIKIFVLNNGGYLTIKQTQQLGFEGRLMGVDKESGLSFPDFRKVADAFGIRKSIIKSHEFIQHQLYFNTFNDDKPHIYEIMMSPDQPQAPRSLNRRLPDGTMNPTKLEDSYPFLDPKIIEEEMKIVN